MLVSGEQGCFRLQFRSAFMLVMRIAGGMRMAMARGKCISPVLQHVLMMRAAADHDVRSKRQKGHQVGCNCEHWQFG